MSLKKSVKSDRDENVLPHWIGGYYGPACSFLCMPSIEQNALDYVAIADIKLTCQCADPRRQNGRNIDLNGNMV